MKNLRVNEKLVQKVLKSGTAFVLASSLLLGSNSIGLSNNVNKVYAQSVSSEEDVNLQVQMGINLYLNDKGFVPTDVNGNETYPFIVDGTTYVPIRAIAQLFNANINWDENSKTVSIATSGEGAKLKHTPRPKQNLYNMNIKATKGIKLVVNGNKIMPTDVNGKVKDIYVVNGTTYVPVRAIVEALCLPITWSDKTNSVFIGNHKTYGLTVENIDDIEAIEQAKKDFILLTVWGVPYICEGVQYDRFDNNRQELAMYIALLNYDYISDETLIEVLPNLTKDDIKRMVYGFGITSYAYYQHQGINTYDWKYITIDEENGNLLDYLESICTKNNSKEYHNKIAKLLYDYIDDNNTTYNHQKENDVMNFIIYSMFNEAYTNGTEYEEDILKIWRRKIKECGKSFATIYNNKVIENFTDRYFNALEKEKQKQLNY